MFPVADDFAAIARRLREIQAEVAKERSAAEAGHQAAEKRQLEPNDVSEDPACA